MNRTIFSLAAAAALFATTGVASADLASEVVSDYEPTAPQIVATPRPSYPFGVPNVSEFDPNPPARIDSARITPYPHDARGVWPSPFPEGSGGR